MRVRQVTSSNEDFSRHFPCYHRVSVTTNIKNSGLLVSIQDGDEENSAAQRKLMAWDQAPHYGKKEKKIGIGKKKSASREVIWGGEGVAEPGDMPWMALIRPPAINLSLKCQHVKFSSRMSA